VDNAQRLGITIIAPVVCDVLDFKGPTAGRIILDVPCSGWGVLAKHSDLRWSKTREDSLKLAEIQGKLLRHAADLVNPGGVLVYSTCTIIRDENDQVIEEFLLERPDFIIDRAGTHLPEELVNERGFVKTYPDIENLDGAFCVRLKKKLGADRKKA
jgi:16S rRNA (cytosine967-C5)-methyltransferase